jgi:O-antigen/teichoic acid export membrane protein
MTDRVVPAVNAASSATIVRNTLFNAAGRVWQVAAAFFLTPYVVQAIGVERYGVWAVVGVITGYFGLLDFGMTTALVKFVSEYDAKADRIALARAIHSGAVFYAGFGLAMAVLGTLGVDLILPWFTVPAHLAAETREVLRLGILIFGASHLLNMGHAVLFGLQRMEITNAVAIAQSLVSVAGTVWFLRRGYGLTGLLWNNALVLVAGAVMSVAGIRRILPGFGLYPFRFDFKTLGRLYAYGFQIWTAGLAGLLHHQYDKLLLSHFAGLAAVAQYDIGSRIVAYARELPLILSSAILPAASALDARNDPASLEALYERASKYIVFAATAAAAGILLFAPPFIRLWLGREFEASIATAQILMAGFFFNALTAAGYFILNGMNKPQFGMRSSVAAAVLNVTLSTLLMLAFGYFGMVAGTALALAGAAVYFLAMTHTVIRRPPVRFWGRLLAKPLAAALFAGVLLGQLIPRVGTTWLGLTALVTGFLVLYGLGTWAAGYFDAADKQLIGGLLRRRTPAAGARPAAAVRGRQP